MRWYSSCRYSIEMFALVLAFLNKTNTTCKTKKTFQVYLLEDFEKNNVAFESSFSENVQRSVYKFSSELFRSGSNWLITLTAAANRFALYCKVPLFTIIFSWLKVSFVLYGDFYAWKAFREFWILVLCPFDCAYLI